MNPEPNQPTPDDLDPTAGDLDSTIVNQDKNASEDDPNADVDSSKDRGGPASDAADEDADVTMESQMHSQVSARPLEPTRLDETVVARPQVDDFGEATLAPSQTGRPRQTAKMDNATYASQSPLDANRGHHVADKSGIPFDYRSGTIGRYTIIRLLGEGAFGRVFEAHDPQLDRKVAIKVAKQLSRKTQIKRFLREARAAAHLRHPNIIPVYEYGLVENKNIIVYEFVQGETLKSYIARKKKVSLPESIRIVRKIAEGLNYAHEQGIIHRDMKPDNVLIDQTGHPHIADFGCARSIDDQTHLTVDGSILGTPVYMSPEQASGRSSAADGRTDIWSLGVILYEMVAGQRPFRGKVTDLLQRICNDDARPLRKLNPEAPVDIETICAKCLTRDLDKRLASAQLLSDELGRFERGEPILSRPIGPIRRTWMWAKRNQAVATLLVTVAVTLLVGTIVSSTFAIQAYREQKNRAMAQLNALTTSEPEKLPEIFEALVPFRATLLPRLRQQLAEGGNTRKEQHRLRMAMLELETNDVLKEKMADELVEYLLTSDAGDFSICRMCLRFRKNDLTKRLWKTALDAAYSDAGRRFRAAAALALYAPESPNWEKVAPDIAGYLTALNQIEMSYWMDSLDSLVLVRHWLKPTLVAEYADQADGADTTPSRAAAVISLMYTDQTEFLAGLIPNASSRQLPLLTNALKIHQTDAITQLQSRLDRLAVSQRKGPESVRQRSNLITALIQLGDAHQWNYFVDISDASVATDLIERMGPASSPFEILLKQIQKWNSIDPDLLSGILLSLGQFKQNQIPVSQKDNLRPTLLTIFSTHPDSRVHSSARWLLGKWKFQDELSKTEEQLRRAVPDLHKNWHVDLAGNTFALLGPVKQFPMGLDKQQAYPPEFDITDVFDEPFHLKQIPRRFGICIHEVTIQQFEEFETELLERLQMQLGQMTEATDAKARQELELRIKNIERVQKRRSGLDKSLPIGDIDYFTSLAFCRWLSEKQKLASGLPSVDQLRQVYETRTDFRLKQADLDRPGYRLPTASEWELACRNGSRTIFPFGRSTEFAGRYAWFATNSNTSLHPVGELKPGNSGMFDILGNVSEWCLDWYQEKLPTRESPSGQNVWVDFGPEFQQQSPSREHRGGSFADEVIDLRSTRRFSLRPISGLPRVGFRLRNLFPVVQRFAENRGKRFRNQQKKRSSHRRMMTLRG